MGDVGDDMNAWKEQKKERKAINRESSAQWLKDRDIFFEPKNGGAHLIVEGKECYIDFWPGTGKWISRCGRKGFGVSGLVRFINEPPHNT